MAVSQTLTLTEVPGSANVANNTSQVKIVWKSTQTNNSQNLVSAEAYYDVSINGAAGSRTVITEPKLHLRTTDTILEKTITVNHKDDGSGTVKVSTWMDTKISAGVVKQEKSIILATIPRASTIDSALDIILGNNCSVKWTPKSSAYRYKLKFELGNWSFTTKVIHPNQTTSYTYTDFEIPLDVAEQITNSRLGTVRVTLYTYSNSDATEQVGTADTKTFVVTVPEFEASPSVSFTLLVPTGDLPEAFNGLYIQGKTGLQATMEITTKYDAGVKNSYIVVANKTYGSPYKVGYLTQTEDIVIKGYALDTREYQGECEETIYVIPYVAPKIMDVAVYRSDAAGIQKDDGTYLRIHATREYSKVEVAGTPKNFCAIRYRYKAESAAGYSDWITILSRDSLETDTVMTDAMLGGTFSNQTTYIVQVQSIDDIGEESTTTITVPTEKVYWHRNGARRSFTFGGYVEEDNTFAIAEDIQFKVKSEKWIPFDLPADLGTSPSTGNFGRCPDNTKAWYRIANGNHVYIAFNVNGSGTFLVIPKEIRPHREIRSVCVNGYGEPVIICVGESGYVSVDTSTGGGGLTAGIDGYIDYFI